MQTLKKCKFSTTANRSTTVKAQLILNDLGTAKVQGGAHAAPAMVSKSLQNKINRIDNHCSFFAKITYGGFQHRLGNRGQILCH